MYVIIGLVLVMASMLGGYMMHGGNLLVLVQPSEFIIIGGVALGSMLVANPMHIVKGVFAGVMKTMKGPDVSKEAFLDLIQLLYETFQFAKKEGLIALEKHVEEPKSSSIFSKYPTFLANHHAEVFLCDTLKVLLSGGIPPYDLEELMDIDLEALHKEEHEVAHALNTVSDAFPAIGIVAAVLGVIITMGSVSEGAETVGAHVAAALVGTFLGVLLSYGIAGPLARNIGLMIESESSYMSCIKVSLLAFSKGLPATVAIEYGRRVIEPNMRPTFEEAEGALKR
ncbi:MAG: flagellar motor stator protein MotA [Ignavibacteriae bacterium HGW-Ignavibacteriae-4]|jgi:chemotaxis protein MotA|nr:MAG: flagellar motor stator protein MotA [Ignavibacteriae bacterium HGW-Ignavibacteriae-4]